MMIPLSLFVSSKLLRYSQHRILSYACCLLSHRDQRISKRSFKKFRAYSSIIGICCRIVFFFFLTHQSKNCASQWRIFNIKTGKAKIYNVRKFLVGMKCSSIFSCMALICKLLAKRLWLWAAEWEKRQADLIKYCCCTHMFARSLALTH